MNTCKNCASQFEITEQDQAFYEKININEPKLCPHCREVRRLSWRNEKNLYKRKCDLCEKQMISTYSENKPFPVYCQECYWSDKWNSEDYTQEINFEESFFDQFEKLQNKTPRLGIINKQSQNSDYCNFSFANKNCHLTFGNHYEEDCQYGHYATKNKDCFDYDSSYNSSLCYEITFSHDCYRSIYLDHSENCQDCYFSVDLKGCKNCMFCSNLRHKQYCILNKQYTKEEYEEKIKSYKLDSYENFQQAKTYFRNGFRTTFPFRHTYIINSENVEGNEIYSSKNIEKSYACENCEDCKYGWRLDETYSSMDITCMGCDKCELCYETIGINGSSFLIACDSVWHSSDVSYSSQCFSSKDCFGSISLNQKKYCILNKQYTKEEYEAVVPKIIEHMKKTGEWGEFFPSSKSPYAYNESVANDIYPTTQSNAEKKGFKWEQIPEPTYSEEDYIPSDSINEETDNIVNGILKCNVCPKRYKITSPEYKFYKNLGIPIPRLCPSCRFINRISTEIGGETFERNCGKCEKAIQTNFSPDRPENVYCEECYEKEVY